MKGGKVIASGTYGCIFEPALVCKGENNRDKNTVSKLMYYYDAKSEMDEITRIADITNKIPDHDDFFILNKIRMCQPSGFTKEDLEDFDKKCTAMTKKGVMENSVEYESKIGNLYSLQLPHGGRDLSYYFYSNLMTQHQFVDINRAMMHLFNNGIIPLNKNGVLHLDIKSMNVVYSEKTNFCKLIDWGISVVIDNDTIPRGVHSWPIMFNQPFTNILFHYNVQNRYNSHKNKTLESVRYMLKKTIFKDRNMIEQTIGKLGHLSFMEHVMNKLLLIEGISPILIASIKQSPFETLTNIICQQMAITLIHFTNKNGKFDDREFFNQVYRHNCDVYGFLMCYIDIMLTEGLPMSLRSDIFNMLYKYCYDSHYCTHRYSYQDINNSVFQLQLQLATKNKLINKTEQRPGAPRIINKSRNTIPQLLKWREKKRCKRGFHYNKNTKKCISVRSKKKKTRRRKSQKAK